MIPHFIIRHWYQIIIAIIAIYFLVKLVGVIAFGLKSELPRIIIKSMVPYSRSTITNTFSRHEKRYLKFSNLVNYLFYFVLVFSTLAMGILGNLF